MATAKTMIKLVYGYSQNHDPWKCDLGFENNSILIVNPCFTFQWVFPENYVSSKGQCNSILVVVFNHEQQMQKQFKSILFMAITETMIVENDNVK